MKIKTASSVVIGSTLSLFWSDAFAHDGQVFSDAYAMLFGNSDKLTMDSRERGVPVMHDSVEAGKY